MIFAMGSVKFVCPLVRGVGVGGSRVPCPGVCGLRLHAALVPHHGGVVLLPPCWTSASSRGFASRILANRSSRRFDSAGSSSPRRLPSAASSIGVDLLGFLAHIVRSRLSAARLPSSCSRSSWPCAATRSLRSLFRPVDRFPSLTIPIRRPGAAPRGTRAETLPGRILRKSLVDYRSQARSLPTMARKARLRSHAAAILRLERMPTGYA